MGSILDSSTIEIKKEILALKESNTPIKKRWAPEKAAERSIKTVSLEVPKKLDISNLFEENKQKCNMTTAQMASELDDIRESTSTPISERYNPVQMDMSNKVEVDSELLKIQSSTQTNLNNRYNPNKEDCGSKSEVDHQLTEIRESKRTPLRDRYKPKVSLQVRNKYQSEF